MRWDVGDRLKTSPWLTTVLVKTQSLAKPCFFQFHLQISRNSLSPLQPSSIIPICARSPKVGDLCISSLRASSLCHRPDDTYRRPMPTPGCRATSTVNFPGYDAADARCHSRQRSGDFHRTVPALVDCSTATANIPEAWRMLTMAVL